MKKIVVLGNGTDWCEKSLSDLKKNRNVKLINGALPCNMRSVEGILAKIHFSLKINRILNLPFKNIWFKEFSKNICEDRNAELILIIYDRNRLANYIPFLQFIREYYTNCKLVYMFTNVVRISGASDNNFVEELNEFYDVVYAFDPSDALRYNFKYSPLIYSVDIMSDKKTKNEVFYVGKAKDRYPMLITIFEKLRRMGIDRRFFIFGVEEEKQKYKDEIVYNKLIPYEECLKHIQESRCLLDVIQGESEGYTIKVCEAVYYNKLLITTNYNVVKEPFYDPNYICVITDSSDIPEGFFDENKKIKYPEEGKAYFSAKSFIDRMYRDLNIDTEEDTV